MSLALLCGAGVGAGLLLIARGLVPRRTPLQLALAQLNRPAISTPIRQTPVTIIERLGQPGAKLLRAAGIDTRRLSGDLQVTGRSPERHLAEKATLGVFGALLPPTTALLMSAGGAGTPALVPAWASVLGAVAGFFAPDLGVRAEAAARRRDFRHALGSFLDLVVISLAGGAGVDAALDEAAQVGTGWAYEQLQDALAAARIRRQPAWVGLAELGGSLGISELEELGAAVSLAGTEGAKVRASLAAKAATLRSHQLAEAEADAQATTERMSLPVVLLFAGFLVFVGYPALNRVLTGL